MVLQNEQLASELIQHMVQLVEIFSADLEGLGQWYSGNFILTVSSSRALEGLVYLCSTGLYLRRFAFVPWLSKTGLTN